jgi:hypothetical protein
MWFHSRQGENTGAGDCGQGMVFAVNPGPGDTFSSFALFQSFQANALAIGQELAAFDVTKY